MTTGKFRARISPHGYGTSCGEPTCLRPHGPAAWQKSPGPRNLSATPPKLPTEDKTGVATRGPFHIEGLESLVFIGQVTPEPLIRREDETAFAPVCATARQAKPPPKPIERTAPAMWEKPGQTPARNPPGFGAVKFEHLNTTPGASRGEESPWMQLFHNARNWVE